MAPDHARDSHYGSDHPSAAAQVPGCAEASYHVGMPVGSGVIGRVVT